MSQRLFAAVAVAALLCACGGKDLGNQLPDAQVQQDATVCVPPRVIYINTDGGNYIPGPTDSTTNASIVLSDAATLDAYAGDVPALINCVETAMADFNVTITTTDPGDIDHYEIVVSGSGSEAFGLSAGLSALAPFTCEEQPRWLSPVFAKTPISNTQACVTTLWSIGSAAQLSHDLECSGPMTFAQYCGGSQPMFRDESTACGDVEARNCPCTGQPEQNHYQQLHANFGVACNN